MADLAAFLARHTPQAEGSVVWGGDPLRITAYLGREPPPLAYVTSVRSLVFREDALLVLRNRDGTHIMPGGRREAGETLEETLRREVLEETSWTLRAPIMLGFMHFHHLGPKPPGHPYPHPDFVQVVYMAEAADFVPDAKLPDDYEIDATFRPIAEVLALALDERLYLEAALQERSAR
jgi:ADP-ribose pyrophosphatase YjhB (NUDIX family)